MWLFIVLRCGVHRKDIYGIFDNLPDALIAQKAAKDLEDDNWHDFRIEERKINVVGYNKENGVSYMGQR
jgi:hypothetical protein